MFLPTSEDRRGEEEGVGRECATFIGQPSLIIKYHIYKK
jgi:hypothetical protein